LVLAPFYIAQEKGLFDKQGIKVELVKIEDFGARRAALSSGKLEGSVETTDSFAIGLAEKLPAIEVLKVDESFGGDGLVVKNEINSIKDLKGKTVAYAKGTPSHFFLLYLLKKEGLTLLCYVESAILGSNSVPQQGQQPISRTNHGCIACNACSHVTPEVFFGAQVNHRHKQIRHRRQDQVVMEPWP
jgi:hypothetical protein